jgi:hypothetical protein
MSPDNLIEDLRRALKIRYANRLHAYGSSDDEPHGYGFRIDGIPATFSAITGSGTIGEGRLDVQVESLPPGEYIFSAELSFDDVLKLIDTFSRPRSQWP